MVAQATGMTDEALFARVAARDQEALACLHDRYGGVLLAVAVRIVRDRAEAEEILTDVLLHAWRHAAAFDPARGSAAGWLVMLCRSRAIDRLRSRARRESARAALALGRTDAPGAEPPAGDPERSAEVALKRRRIRAALSDLTDRQREAIDLAYYGGLSHTEIAAKMGEPLGTVKTWIRQGLVKLRDSLAGRFGESPS